MGDDDADRTRERRRLGEDHVVTAAVGHGHVVAAAGRDPAHAHHHGQVAARGELAEPVVDLVAATHGAAGRIDAEHDRLDALVLGDVVELGADEAVAPHDGAGEVHDRHLRRRRLGERVVLLDDAAVALKVLREGAGAPQGREQRDTRHRPGDPGAPPSPGTGVLEDHPRGRLLAFDLHVLVSCNTEGKARRNRGIVRRGRRRCRAVARPRPRRLP